MLRDQTLKKTRTFSFVPDRKRRDSARISEDLRKSGFVPLGLYPASPLFFSTWPQHSKDKIEEGGVSTICIEAWFCPRSSPTKGRAQDELRTPLASERRGFKPARLDDSLHWFGALTYLWRRFSFFFWKDKSCKKGVALQYLIHTQRREKNCNCNRNIHFPRKNSTNPYVALIHSPRMFMW